MRKWGIIAVLLAVYHLGLFQASEASEKNEYEARTNGEYSALYDVDTITVFGTAGGINEVPGAIAYIDETAIKKQSYTDISRTLRRAPGVNIQDEDGYGLRPNIGLRGSGSNRSARISLMEDGAPIAPAPYAAPEAYYFPYAGRINAVEITKGVGVVKYGPRTSGGALNLYSTPIPKDVSAYAQFLVGSNRGRRVHAYGGGRKNFGSIKTGVLVETYQHQTDGFKYFEAGSNSGFDISDYVVKAGLYSNDDAKINQHLEFKFQTSDQVSHESYVGLTQNDYKRTPFKRYNGTQDDVFKSNHDSFLLNYNAKFSPSISLDTIAYRNEFQRDWFKLERVLGVSTSTILEDPQTYVSEFENLQASLSFLGPDNALELRHNARKYISQGIQNNLSFEISTGDISHFLEASLRWHHDKVDRFQNFEFFRAEYGDLVKTGEAAPGSDSNRIEEGKALSYFFQDNIDWRKIHATLGVRVESIELSRLDYGKADPTRTGKNLSTRMNNITTVSPAVGIVYDVSNNLSVLGGAYVGTAPPSPGNSQSSEEKSLNWEGGVRWANNNTNLEAIGFFNDYSNLLGTCAESTGGNCVIGEQFDAGAVDAYGLELTFNTNLNTVLKVFSSIPLSAAYTFTKAEFKTTFDSQFEPWGNVETGDGLPYIADHQLFVTAGIEENRWGGEIAMLYQSERRTVAGQGQIALDERLEPYAIVDVSVYLKIIEGVNFRAKAENIFDKLYVAADQPAGLRPGLPRTLWAGIEVSL